MEGERKTAVTPLQEVLQDQVFIDLCLGENVAVICVKKEPRKIRSMPFGVMYGNHKEFWLRHSDWDYFLSNEDVEKLKAKAVEPVYSLPEDHGTLGTLVPVLSDDENQDALGFGDGYAAILAMGQSDRVASLRRDKERLEDPLMTKPGNSAFATEVLVETARNAILQNQASLANVMSLPSVDAKKQTQALVDVTRDLVRASARLMSANLFDDDLMSSLVHKSNGTIIQHMTRVYLGGLAFMAYFNRQVSRSHVVSKMRVSFNDKYRRFYQSLMPQVHAEYFTLERIFLGGMRAISESDMYNWATGFLIHDIGKAAAVEYHEGEAAYNRELVMDHVKVGFAGIVGKTNYPQEAAMITGYHHEYYGDPGGYGIFRAYFDQYKKMNSFVKQSCCIAYDLAPVLDYKVLAYFPAKILEIVDVFDSLTDPHRKYKKPLNTEEALEMMQEEFIVKHRKIDIILFDMFSNFVMESPTAWQTNRTNDIIKESLMESGIFQAKKGGSAPGKK